MRQLLKKTWAPYVFPFVLFLLLTELARLLPDWSHVLYITKIMTVGALLWFWRREYAADISLKLSSHECLLAVFSGLLVLIIWIVPEEYLLQLTQVYHDRRQKQEKTANFDSCSPVTC